MATLLEILSDPTACWSRGSPASEAAIHRLSENCDFALPEAYLSFLRYSNGGEGPLNVEPWYFQLWSAEVVIPYNRNYEVAEFLPDYFAIGSNAGGEMLALRKHAVSPCPVYMVPFIPMAESDAVEIANDFKQFAVSFGRSEGRDEGRVPHIEKS